MKKSPFKIVWLFLAFVCMGLGGIGVVLPILPTTPFLLAAAFFFAKGSKRFHNWFIQTKLYKRYLESFVSNRAMTLKTKLCTLLPASAMLLILFFMMKNMPGKIFILILILIKYTYFFTRIKTIAPPNHIG